MNSSPSTPRTSPPGISSDEALRIARADAERAYRDLFLYRIELHLADDGWHIDFEFKDETVHSGGPHYIIDAEDGRILWKCYEQ